MHSTLLDELRSAYRIDPGYKANIAYARAALERNEQLRTARKALDVAISYYQGAFGSGRDWVATRDAHRDALVEALAMRAEVRRRLGQARAASDDAAHALLMGDTPVAHLVLGLCTRGTRGGSSFEHLSLGLAAGSSGFPALDTQALEALEADWPQQGWWIPGGAASWLALVAQDPSPTDSQDQPRVAREPFPDLELTVDGEQRPLSSFTGPVVVDLWATWCGPCRMALPQLHLRAHESPEITFLAVSVDKSPEDAGEYLSDSTPAFQQAWAGPDAMKTIGISGIPSVFFLDAEHRVVATETGWSSDGSGLDEGLQELRRAVAESPGSGEGER